MYATLKNKEKNIIKAKFDQLFKETPAGKGMRFGVPKTHMQGQVEGHGHFLSVTGRSPPSTAASEAAIPVECTKCYPLALSPPHSMCDNHVLLGPNH